MGRKVAILWHASFSIAAGALYFFFVLPRWPELMGDTTHKLGTVFRIVSGVLIALAALPVVFTLLRTRKPEFGTPQLALRLRTWSIVGHVLAGALIIGTAISEIWLSLDAAGQWLFGIYGGAAAVAILGLFAFYLSFIAELPPPPPKPLKPKKRAGQRRIRRKKHDKGDDAATEAEAETKTEAPETAEAQTEAAAATDSEPADEAGDTADDETAAAVDGGDGEESEEAEQPEESEESSQGEVDEATEADVDEPAKDDEQKDDEPALTGRLRNHRPAGKAMTSRRRRRRRDDVTVDD